jgi:hypothetical protein
LLDPGLIQFLKSMIASRHTKPERYVLNRYLNTEKEAFHPKGSRRSCPLLRDAKERGDSDDQEN